MKQPRREELVRYAAPAAFLVAVTIAVILIHNGLQSGSNAADTTPTVASVSTRATTRSVATTTHAATTTAATDTASTSTETTATDTTGAEYYTVQTGDTLGTIAAQYSTTSDAIEALNPGIDPHALQVGQKIRVK